MIEQKNIIDYPILITPRRRFPQQIVRVAKELREYTNKRDKTGGECC